MPLILCLFVFLFKIIYIPVYRGARQAIIVLAHSSLTRAAEFQMVLPPGISRAVFLCKMLRLWVSTTAVWHYNNALLAHWHFCETAGDFFAKC